MKTIPLTQGKFAIVDDDDFNWLNQWKWYAAKDGLSWYVCRGRLSIKMHREILGLKKGDGKETDHKNGNGLDNRRCNLRICTRAENVRNMQKDNNCTSKYKGVHWQKGEIRKGKQYKGKWASQIVYNYKHIYLGLFNNEIDAAFAYDKAAKELFGEFVYLNFPEKEMSKIV